MARDIYKRPVGNPIQFDTLPKGHVELCFPIRSESEGGDNRRALFIALMLVVVSVASILTQVCFFGRSPDLHNRILGTGDYIFWGIALFLILRRSVIGTLLALGCALSVYLYLQLSFSLELQFIVLAGLMGGLTWYFAQHWVSLCTASPMDRKTATKLRDNWSGYASCAALVPLGAVLVSRLSDAEWLPHLALSCFLLLQVLLTIRQRGSSVVCIVAESLRSWLTYGNDNHVPGSLLSPAGPRRLRLAMTGLCVFVCALTSLHWLEERTEAEVGNRFGNMPSSTPGMLLPSPLAAPTGHPLGHVLLGVGQVLVTLALPAVVVLVTPAVLTLPMLTQAAYFRKKKVKPRHWKAIVEGVQQSTDPIERRSLYMGQLASDGSPLLIPRKVFGEHAHFLGASGAGKTSLGLAPWIEQAFIGEDCSVVVVDLKADSMELYGAMQAAAEQREERTRRTIPRRTIPLRHVSNQLRNTFAFNPLRQSYWSSLDAYAKTDILCGALGLTYGSDYGEGYYSSANAAVLYHAIQTFPDVDTFRELADRVGYVAKNANPTDLNPEIRKAGNHVHAVLKRLSAFEALNVAPNGQYADDVIDHAIDLQSVFRQPELCYFHLSSTLGPGSSPEIARLVTYSLLTAATQTERRVPVYLVIDEFQRMVAHNVEYMLQLARSMGVGVILANQSMEDLKSSKTDLINAVEANCHYRQWFTVPTSKDTQRVITASGETCDQLVTTSRSVNDRGETTRGVSRSELITPRFPINEVLRVNADPLLSIVNVSRGDGYALYGGLPVIVESNYHITPDVYEKRRSMPWPESLPGSFTPGNDSESGPTASKPGSPPPSGPGPSISTEIIGAKQKPRGTNWENPFAGLPPSGPSAPTHAGQKRGKGKKQ